MGLNIHSNHLGEGNCLSSIDCGHPCAVIANRGLHVFMLRCEWTKPVHTHLSTYTNLITIITVALQTPSKPKARQSAPLLRVVYSIILDILDQVRALPGVGVIVLTWLMFAPMCGSAILFLVLVVRTNTDVMRWWMHSYQDASRLDLAQVLLACVLGSAGLCLTLDVRTNADVRRSACQMLHRPVSISHGSSFKYHSFEISTEGLSI